MRLAFLLSALLLVATPALADRAQPLLVGTGAVTGIYFPAAGAVQRILSDAGVQPPLAEQSTAGSIANLKALADGGLDLALAQSDWAYYASHGQQEQFPTGNDTYRVLFGLHSELLTIIARKDAGIATLEDLKGKKINLGPTASGTRALMDLIFKAESWGMTDMGTLLDLEPGEQSAALCDGRVDAIVFLVPHPNAAVQEALARCPSVLVPVRGAAVDSIVAAHPFYHKITIPTKLYAEAMEGAPTFGMQALFLATSRLSDADVTSIVKTVFENLPKLNALHPALAKLTAKDMVADSYGIPLHPGAEKYFREAGLLVAKAP